MKKRTIELIQKALGKEAKKTSTGLVFKDSGKIFTTGQEIQKECEELEHIIERYGEEAFLERVRRIIHGRGSLKGISEDSAKNNNTSKSNT